MENQSLQIDAISHETPIFAPGSPRKRAALDAAHRLQPPPGLRAAGDDDSGGGEGLSTGLHLSQLGGAYDPRCDTCFQAFLRLLV